MDSSHHQGSYIARVIWIVGSPIVFAVGVPGNLFTITVLLRSNHKRSSTSVFLTFLAFADLLVLTITLPRWWLIYVFGIDIRHVSDASCKLHWFFTYYNGCLSSAILVAVTVERIISIIRPYKVKTWCTVNTAIIASITIIMVLIAFHGHNLHGMKLFRVTQYQVDHDGVNNTIQCKDDTPELSNGTRVRPKMTDQSVLIVENKTAVFDNRTKARVFNVCNSTESNICFNVTKSDMLLDQKSFVQNDTCEIVLRKEKTISVCWFDDPTYGKFYMGPYTLLTLFIYNVVTETIILVGILVIFRQLAASKRLRKRMEVNIARETGIKAQKSTFESHSAQITRSLLLVSAVFICCATPVQVFLAGRSVWIDPEKGMTVAQEIIWVVCNMLYYINHAVNFILYFLSGARFRKEVKETFRFNKREKKHNGLSLSHLMNSEMVKRHSNSDCVHRVPSVNRF